MMNLRKKYKQLFEGKVRSNDALLLTEGVVSMYKDAKTYLPIVKADAKLKQLGMTNVEITPEKELKITFKSKIPYNSPKSDQISDIILNLIPSEDRDAGLGYPADEKSIHVSFQGTVSSTSSSTGARNLETDDEFYDVVATIYSGAGDDNTNMTDDITDELGDYYDDIYNNPNNKKLIDAYDDLRSTINGTNDEQYEAAKALLDLLR